MTLRYGTGEIRWFNCPACMLHHDDCHPVLRAMEDNNVDSTATDPPGGISFANQKWDSDRGGPGQWIGWMTEIASECHRVMKSGGHAVVWALPRTSNWTATAWESAGWDVRDRISHLFGSGFPKSLNVSAAIDKHLAAGRRLMVGWDHPSSNDEEEAAALYRQLPAPNTPEAQQYAGWGTGLKPAMEDWWLFRKPLSEKTPPPTC